MLKCRKCAGHNVEIAVRGHAKICPYRLCPCPKCQKVVSKRLSSVKRRYKNSDVVFVNVECNSGNVRVQAIPKTLVDSIKSTTIVSTPNHCRQSKSKTDEEMCSSTAEPTNQVNRKEVLNPMVNPMVSNIFNLFNYLKMEPNQQMNFLSTFAWILQTTQINRTIEDNVDEN